MSVSAKQAVNVIPGDVVAFAHPEKETFSALVTGTSGSEFDAKVILTVVTFEGQYIEVIATPDQEVAVA